MFRKDAGTFHLGLVIITKQRVMKGEIAPFPSILLSADKGVFLNKSVRFN
jgi:hypothetical protein